MKAFEGKVAVITGGAHGIGRATADAFLREGAKVHIIDKQPGDWFVGDISDRETLEKFAETVIAESGRVDILVNNALPLMKGIDECSWEEFSYALAVGVTAPFYLTKLLAPHFAPGASRNQPFLLQGPDEPAPDGELHRRQGRYCRADPCPGREPGREGPGEQHLPRLDRHHRQ